MQQNHLTQTISYFSRWTRKSYAVFNSLNKVVKISGLSVALTAVALPGVVHAQQDTTRVVTSEYDLDEVEIVEPELLKVFEVPSRVIAVVGQQELQSSPIESVQDILNYLSQIDLRQRGNNDVQADISIRGGTFDQVLILLNGVNITNPQTGHHNLDLPITFDQIERVEILNGAGSQSYGANAYGGVVNIVTKSDSKNSVILNALAGDYGLYNLGISANFVKKRHRHFLAINRNASSGYTQNTDFERTSLYYNWKYMLKKSFFELQLSGAQKAFGAQSFYTAKYPNQFEETQSGLASLNYQSFGKISTKTVAYWNLHSDRFELFRNNEDAPSWYKNHNYHLTQVVGGNTKAFVEGKFGKTTLGVDVRYENIASNVLGVPTDDTVSAWFNPEGYYTKEASRFNTSLSLEQSYSTNRFKAVVALMFNSNTAYTNSFDWYPGIDFDYRITKYLKLVSSFNKSLRLPTFTDLYYAGPSNIGNPDLIAEESYNIDIGAQYAKGIFNAGVTAFSNFGKNNIDWVRREDSQKWQQMNVSNVNTYGLDIQVGTDFDKLKGHSVFIKNISLQYTFINKKMNSQGYESHYVMDYLRSKLVLGLQHKIYKNISATWKFRYQERNGNYMLWDPIAKSDISTPYEPYSLLDVRISWKYKSWHAYIDVKNIFDVHYIDYGNVLQPGRWASIGVKKSFYWK